MSEIIGYSELTSNQVDYINIVKLKGLEVEKLIANLRDYVDGVDERWLAISTTNLQIGFMTLARAIAHPDGF